MEATHPLHHPGFLLRHKQDHSVHGKAGRPSLLGWCHPQPRHGLLRLLQWHISTKKCHMDGFKPYRLNSHQVPFEMDTVPKSERTWPNSWLHRALLKVWCWSSCWRAVFDKPGLFCTDHSPADYSLEICIIFQHFDFKSSLTAYYSPGWCHCWCNFNTRIYLLKLPTSHPNSN